MSNTIKIVLAFGLVTVAAACGNRASEEEIVFVEPAPIVAEPTFSKF